MTERRFPGLGMVCAGFVVFWFLLIALFAAQMSMGGQEPGREFLRDAIVLWMPWILVSPLMILMAYMLPPGSRPGWQWLPAHVAGCLAILFLAGWLDQAISRPENLPPESRPGAGGFPPPLPPGPPGYPPPVPHPRPGPIEKSIPVGIPLYVAAVVLVGLFHLRRISAEKESRTAELEKQLTAARLETLRSQLQPHFLFNTLNTVASLVHSDPQKAEAVILNLSSLLRATLKAKDKPLIPLRKELKLAQDYLEIQRARHGDQLEVEQDIPESVMSCAIPPLILQPILENAVKFGVNQNPRGGRIRLRAARIGEKIVMEVEDSGSGTHTDSIEGHGVGVSNTRARLAASFPGREVGFDILPNDKGGITVRMQFPAVATGPVASPS